MNNGNFLKQVQNSINEVDLKKIDEVSKIILKKKSQIFLAGNGASASIANHVATDLTKSAGFNARTLNESNLITCLSNDFGYENSNPLRKLGKYNFYVKSKIYNVIETTHLIILLNIVENLIKIRNNY